jgi:ABC-type Fe3+/spermidine/putrescine transport system ATPase subunit
MLRLTGIAVELGGFSLELDSLELTPGEYLAILGPNGAGKTVLLETIAGLHPVKTGMVEFLGAGATSVATEAATGPAVGAADWQNVTSWPPEQRRLGFVYQDYLLFPHLSVGDNIGFGLKGLLPSADRVGRIREVALLTGVAGLLGRKVTGLSGGEQQKVALARALAIRPKLLLLDEPLAAFDRSARRETAGEVKRLCRRLGVTVLHVTHSLNEAVSLGDRVAVMAAGRLLQAGVPAEVLRAPASRRVAGLVGCENLLEGTVNAVGVEVAGGPALTTGAPNGGADGAAGGGIPRPVTVALRAEDLVLEAAGTPAAGRSNLFPVLVESVEPGPAHWTVRARYAGEAAGSAGVAPLFSVFVLPPEVARLALAPGALAQMWVDPDRVAICPG